MSAVDTRYRDSDASAPASELHAGREYPSCYAARVAMATNTTGRGYSTKMDTPFTLMVRSGPCTVQESNEFEGSLLYSFPAEGLGTRQWRTRYVRRVQSVTDRVSLSTGTGAVERFSDASQT